MSECKHLERDKTYIAVCPCVLHDLEVILHKKLGFTLHADNEDYDVELESLNDAIRFVLNKYLTAPPRRWGEIGGRK